jgi:DNA-binding transcriptional MerR regulator
MTDYYSTKDASQLTGASRPIIRTYTQRYARFLSTEATPEAGAERRFTAADLKVIAYIYQRTSAGATHEQVLERLAAGELDQFDWQPAEPESAAQGGPAAESASSALVPIERLQAAHALMADAQRREAEAAAQVIALQSEVQRLSQALGKAEGEAALAAAAQVAAAQAEVQRLTLELGKAQGEAATLKSSRYAAPRWWRAVFGGRQGDTPG